MTSLARELYAEMLITKLINIGQHRVAAALRSLGQAYANGEVDEEKLLHAMSNARRIVYAKTPPRLAS
jgi:hypothetical protein